MGFLWVSYGRHKKIADRPGLCARCATGPRSRHSGPALGLQQRGGIRNVDPQRPLDDLVVPLGNLHMSLYDSILVGCRWSIMGCMYIYIYIHIYIYVYTQMYWTADSDWQLFFARYPKPPWMSCGIIIFVSSPKWNLRNDGGLETFYLMGSKRSPDIFWQDAKWLVRRAETAKQKGSEMIGAQHWGPDPSIMKTDGWSLWGKGSPGWRE